MKYYRMKQTDHKYFDTMVCFFIFIKFVLSSKNTIGNALFYLTDKTKPSTIKGELNCAYKVGL